MNLHVTIKDYEPAGELITLNLVTLYIHVLGMLYFTFCKYLVKSIPFFAISRITPASFVTSRMLWI